ncbi:hypothetical protein, unknown function [Leishmania braziliensis MHOM/BR/75/M2904]|uniref:sn-1-specific diacylglycerol lipase n=2 Tax=Leishmania braziliensis TaxID=5660 RepID=A4HFY8_LEIBR|nr:hypothetical protein, unknown function [Leishmania braziliensis MHOM/BR/75/M2904]CAJ2475442.1 unnamed protein product [Leishmania braziliensis]CAM45506.1 hypothetical protein, unknown function [Leishmania braziliensis MHOM/BR/75/M2904]
MSSSDFLQYLTEQKAAVLKLFREGQQQGAATRSSESIAAAAAAASPKAPPRTCEAAPPDPNDTLVEVAANRSWSPPPARSTMLADFISDNAFFSSFLSYLSLADIYPVAERMMDPSTPMRTGGLGGRAEGAGSTRTVPECRAPLSSLSPMHVHQLRPTQFFLPALCEVCKAAMLKRIWLNPQPPETTSTTPQSGTASSSPFALLLSLPELLITKSANSTSASDQSTPSEAVCSPSSSTSSPGLTAVTAAPSQPLLGFGKEGYRCDICDLVLHFHCITKMRQTQACEVLSPAAHQILSSSSTSASSSPTTSASPTLAAVATGIASSLTASRPFSWDRVKAILESYLHTDDGAYNRRAANVKAVLGGVCALLDKVIARYPTMTPLTFVKRYSAMQDLSSAHQTLYAACVASLDDTALLRGISWDEVRLHQQARTGVTATTSPTSVFAAMRPLRVDKLVFENLKTSVSGAGGNGFFPSPFSREATTPMTAQWTASNGNEDATPSTWPIAHYPVQFLLWQAMRYATAVYGEVYRRGSLSSTLSAALLFTLNRSAVEVPKQVNDAAVTTLLGLPPSALQLSRWGSQVTEPSYVLLVDDVAGSIVVSFRGTLSTFDIITDLAATTQPFCGGHAHQGAAEVVNTLFDQRSSRYGERVEQRKKTGAAMTAVAGATDKTSATAEDATRRLNVRAAAAPSPPARRVVSVEEPTSFHSTSSKTDDIGAPEASKESVMTVLEPCALQPLDTPDGLLDGLEQLAAEHPSYSILITGHSLGGGVAVLFATRLHYDQALPPAVLKRIHVIAFAPMPTLSLPAASCFDEVSTRGDGGYSSRDTAPQSTPAACFPVWNVVNGFDCVPRLQLNTVDRLLRQVVEPQIAASAEVPSAAASSALTPATADAEHQVLRELCERDAAAHGADTGAHEEMGMVGMSAMPTPITTVKASLARLPKDNTATAADDTVEDPVQASVFGAMSKVRTPSGFVGARGGAVGAEEIDVIVAAPKEKAIASSSTASRSATSVAGTPQFDELLTSTDGGAQGRSHLGSLPLESEGRTYDVRDLSHELHHPGRVLLLTSPWDIITNRLVDVPRGHPVMHELFLMKSMLMQHMVDAYSASLREIHEAPRCASGEERA